MTSQYTRIKTLVDMSDHPITPREIALQLNIDPKTVAARLGDLVKKGMIRKKDHGRYIPNPIHGMGSDKPPRLQNLLFTATESKDGSTFKIPKGMRDMLIPIEDDAQMRLIFGSKRNKITWTVKTPLGIDLYSLRLAKRIIDSECKTRNFKNIQWYAINYELLIDDEKVRIEGAKCFTFEAFDGSIEKYYNKDSGHRREVRPKATTTIENLIGLVRGGMPAYNIMQSVHYLSQKIEASTEVSKSTNRLLSDAHRLNKASYEANLRREAIELKNNELLKEILNKSKGGDKS